MRNSLFDAKHPATGGASAAIAFALFAVLLLTARCHQGGMTAAEKDSLAMRKAYAESPVLSPAEALKHFQLDQGLQISLVAAEPLVHTPVAALFDERGRMWVLEMNGYMPDTSGTGENRPLGKVIILEDSDHNGSMDSRKVFMDSLVMPRAICLYQGGLLVAEPPKLWFVEIRDDHAGTRQLVDSTYAVGGNVEHQPNGLLRGIDNWLYNAKSAKRYRRRNGRWEIQRTHFRGQWGISQDNDGRLFYNNNSENLLGDYFLPGLGAWNPDMRHVSGFNEDIVHDNRTYPIRATPGVNRGYQPQVLDDSLRLVNFTAACGPLIYRDGVLGAGYRYNAFVAEPSANLIKRNILRDTGYKVLGKQAYQGKEFLASDDERFRPVNLYSGPDGCLYILDMYRGIIQHRTYLTPYLKNEIAMRALSQPLNLGRIYRIAAAAGAAAAPDLSRASAAQLVGFLDHPQSWVRETAERLLTDRHMTEAEGLLRARMAKDTLTNGRILAFWTLEGLGLLKDADIQAFWASGDVRLQQQAVAAAVAGMTRSNAARWLKAAAASLETSTPRMAPYWTFVAAAAMAYQPASAEPLLLKTALAYKRDPYVSDAVISGLHDHEEKFLTQFTREDADTNLVFTRHLRSTIERRRDRLSQGHKKALTGALAHGQQLFETYCQVCHGADGNGIRSLGAPLNGSSWVTGDKKTLLAIVLVGLNGPIKIGDKVYRQPEVSGEMPGMGQNDQLSDQDIADILGYIRSAWTNKAGPVTADEVRQARETHKNREKAFTMEELP